MENKSAEFYYKYLCPFCLSRFTKVCETKKSGVQFFKCLEGSCGTQAFFNPFLGGMWIVEQLFLEMKKSGVPAELTAVTSGISDDGNLEKFFSENRPGPMYKGFFCPYCFTCRATIGKSKSKNKKNQAYLFCQNCNARAFFLPGKLKSLQVIERMTVLVDIDDLRLSWREKQSSTY